MKIALYIEDGVEQIVLTPETETEKGIISKLHDGTRDFSIKRGSFYECRGGWHRQGSNGDSTMIVLRRASTEAELAAAAAKLSNDEAATIFPPFNTGTP